MRTEHLLRTAILAAWLVALLVHAPLTARTALLDAAVALIGAVPLLRQRVAPTTRTTDTASNNRRVAEFQCDIEPVGTSLLVRIRGELSVASAPTVRTALLKCLVEQPDAVVVDLSGIIAARPAAVTLLLAASRQAALWPGIPLLLAAPGPELDGLVGRGYDGLTVHASVDEALAASPRRRSPSVRDTLLPASGAARHARDLATEACTRWDLPDLIGPAALIAGELVTNAVVHAQTMIDLQVTLGRRYLIVAVRDGSTEAPVLPPDASPDPAAPRGLLLVNAAAYRWGFLPAYGGKVVWATLRRSPDGEA